MFFDWTKSTRSIAVVFILIIITIALYMGKLTGDNIMMVATLILGAYFGKRDTKEDRDN